jgi:phosphate transport system substrate-binding protein
LFVPQFVQAGQFIQGRALSSGAVRIFPLPFGMRQQNVIQAKSPESDMKINLRANHPDSRNFGKHFGLVFLGLLLAGCPAGNQSTDSSGSVTSAPANVDKLVIRGSNTIGEELAPRLIAEFKKDHPGITFELEPKATGYGMAALRAGQCDIAAASREAIPEELELAKTSGIEMKDYVLGAYSVGVVINANNPLTNLTKDQVHDIFTGKITNWKEVGGPDAAIQLYIRDPISGTHLGFKELAMKNEPYAAHPHVFPSYPAIVQAVADDANGIGYSGIEMATSSGAKLVTIEGVETSDASVNSGKYPYARTLRFYTNKTNESQATKDFIQFVLSKRGQEIMAQMGFTPRP